jgi:hypothetical protein
VSLPATHNLAELNIGRLLASVDSPQVVEFMDNIDRINGLGKRSDGFVWMMEGSGDPNTGNTQTKLNGDPQMVSNLTVWRDLASLEAFVFKTLHKQFFARRAEWFEAPTSPHFVMWWVPKGHQPSLEEALGKLADLTENGDSEAAFGWAYARKTWGAAA